MIQIGWAYVGCMYDGTLTAPDRDSALEVLADFLRDSGLNRRRTEKIAKELRSRGIYYFSPLERYLLCMGDFVELSEVSDLEAECD